MSVLPGAEPFDAEGGPIGVLLVHGFTSTPQSLRPWAEHLAGAGFAVSLPRLPGHGTRWQDLNATRWTDWYGQVERSFDALRARCETVYAGGLSMGGALALRLAEQRAGEVAGLILVNPAIGSTRRDLRYLLPLLHRVVPSLAGLAGDIKAPGRTELAYDRTPLRALHSLTRLWPSVVADLPKIVAPILLYRSRVDHVVEPLSAQLLRRGTSSTKVEEHVLEDSYHVAPLDADAPAIFAGTVEWIRARGAAEPGASRDAGGTAGRAG